MINIPKTSVSLLNAIAASPDSARWPDFYERYKPVMESFLKGKFSSLEMEDVIQDAMIAFMEKVPAYQYDPKLKGAFHCYLLGITKFKALEFLRRRCNEAKKTDNFKVLEDIRCESNKGQYLEEDEFQKAIARIAIKQFLLDETVSIRDREVFRRTAIKKEQPNAVAEAYGITRNNVDQIKARALKKIREVAVQMENLEGGRDESSRRN